MIPRILGKSELSLQRWIAWSCTDMIKICHDVMAKHPEKKVEIEEVLPEFISIRRDAWKKIRNLRKLAHKS